MSKSKKKHGSAFAVLFVILLLLSVAFTVCSNVVFSGDRVPMIAGYYLYLHEKSDMEPDIPANSLVIAKSAEQESLQAGSKVLCYLADGNMALRCIYNIDVNEEGTSLYYPGTALEQGNELTIERKNIFAVCLWASKEMYTVIQFATSVIGLMAMLVVPCIILIIMLLIKIAKSSRDEDEDEDEYTFDEDDYEEESPRRSKRSQGPLFDPEQAGMEDDSLEKKKASIQENFSEKPVNENSPYQKAVQERTMKFKKIEEEDIERAKRATAAARAASGSLYVPPQQADASAPQPQQFEQQAEADAQQAKPYVPTHSADVPVVRSSEPDEPKTETPNIDDIINPSQLRAAKAGQRYNPDIAGTDSINDLIAALEKEKKKL